MGLMNAIGRGLSAAGYAGADYFAKSALMDQQSALETARQERLAEVQDMLAGRAERRRADMDLEYTPKKAQAAADAALATAPTLAKAKVAGEYAPEVTAAQARAEAEKATARTTAETEALKARGNDKAALTAMRNLAQAQHVEGLGSIKTAALAQMQIDEKRKIDALIGEAVTTTDPQRKEAIRQELVLRGVLKEGKKDDPPNGYRWKADGALEPIPGGPADPNVKPAGGKPLNEGQAKALLFGSRMQAANDVLDDLEKRGKKFSTPGAKAPILGPAVNLLNTRDGQMLDQAKRDFTNAVLRRESGAVISDAEFANAERQYFPQLGDAPEVVEQKRRNRELATRGILAEVPDGEARVRKVRAEGAPRSPNTGGATGGWSIREVK